MPLSEVEVGTKCIVSSVECYPAMKRHITDMGLTKGTAITVDGLAPFGDPMRITLRGFQVAIRKDDARLIDVTPV